MVKDCGYYCSVLSELTVGLGELKGNKQAEGVMKDGLGGVTDGLSGGGLDGLKKNF